MTERLNGTELGNSSSEDTDSVKTKDILRLSKSVGLFQLFERH